MILERLYVFSLYALLACIFMGVGDYTDFIKLARAAVLWACHAGIEVMK